MISVLGYSYSEGFNEAIDLFSVNSLSVKHQEESISK